MTALYSLDRYAESWIEVSSQPSTSSLSSANPDDANPAALGVQFDQHGRRRRRLLRTDPDGPQVIAARRRSVASRSSQEEYEESESESDRIMTSSNENVDGPISNEPSPQSGPSSDSNKAIEEDDDDENSTALGVANEVPAFTPPPNAFSHPHGHTYIAQGHTRSHETRTSYFPARRPANPRRPSAQSYPSRGSRNTHSPYDIISSSHQPDHDAALRASLSTLLSCAAAARGLPKQNTYPSGGTVGFASGPSNQIEPSALRLLPESALPPSSTPPVTESPIGQQSPSEGPPLPPRPRSSSEKSKRKASPSSKDRNSGGNSKKRARASSPRPRHNDTTIPNSELVQPSLMTWVVSAGVVLIFSAISFSAGYAIGREVGRIESGGVLREEGVVCGREVGKGLRRLRWGSGSGSLSVIRT